MADLTFTPATELRDLIRSRQVSPVEVLESVLARAEAVQPRLYPFVTLDAETARTTARAAEAAVMRQAPLGALHGIPISIKDLDPTSGLRTTYGSKFSEDNIPTFDSVVVERVRAAGGIIFAKTNTPSYGHKDSCDNLIMPPTRNPWKADRTSGASSGGAAVAVAVGAGPLAHGSDGAGSIRIPAALCGVFGLKPSFGRVPYWPNADIWAARSHSGPITRTVRDAGLLLGVLAGPDARDPLSLDVTHQDYAAACQPGELNGLKVAWSADFGYAKVDPEVRAVAQASARRFEELGCSVEAVDPGWDDPAPWAEKLWHMNMAARFSDQLDERPEWIEPSLRTMIEAGRRLSGLEAGRAQVARTAFYNQAQRFMERFDLLLTPQMPCVAWAAERAPAEADASIFDHLPFTFPFNGTGWPAASVPCGFNSEGLPIGLQIVAPWRRDDLCLRAAAAFEALQPWHARRPL
ncbi:MAG TPA: amidase family protein [Chloroflexota bacterium]|nr:amidase family protein [Chloroflexota bacterium]